MSVSKIDVFVAGGGPAGLALAIAARVRGLTVAVFDPARPPIDKACGEGIMPLGVSVLRTLGIDLARVPSALFRGIKFVESNTQVSAWFSDGAAYGVRRTTLHRVMADRAQQSGVELHWGRRVTGVTASGALVEGEETPARYIVFANGQNSHLRSAAGFSEGKVSTRRYGFRQHFAVRPWSDLVEVYWCDEGQIYVTPVSSEEIGVALLTRNKHLAFDEALSLCPELANRLRDGERTSRLAGALTLTRHVPTVARGNIALLGDASGSADAITGDGLSLAFREALMLSDAISRGDLNAYQREHQWITRRPLAMGRALLLMDGRPTLRRFVFRRFQSIPALFGALLRFHTAGEVAESENTAKAAA